MSQPLSASASAAVLATQQQNQLVVQIIHDAEAASTAAKRVAAAAAEKLRKLERAWEKLTAAQIELHNQSRESESSLRGLHSRIADFDAQGERLRAEFNVQKDELQRILDNLAARPLAACLQAAHSPTPPPLPPADGSVHPPSSLSRGSSQPPPLQTLFDFIDVDSLHLVHSHFLQSMAELARVSEVSRSEVLSKPEGMMAAVREMENTLTEKMSAGTGVPAEVVAANLPALPMAPADASSAASMASATSASNASYLAAASADPSVVGQCRAAFSALEAEVAAIPDLFSSMCRSYDRVRQARQAAAANAHSAAAASAAASSAAANDVLSEISQMQHLLQQIHARSARASALVHHMDSCNAVHSALYTSTLDLYQHLERLGPALQTAVASFQSLELQHSSLVHTASTAIQELHNLSLFYLQFERAYESLLDEIQRRHSANASLTAMISHMRAQLLEAHQAELTDREHFQANFGKYLPPSLCPAIFEAVAEYKIYPLEDPQTELPVHVPSHAEMERGAQRRETERQFQQQQHQHHDQQQPPPQSHDSTAPSSQSQPHYDGLSPPPILHHPHPAHQAGSSHPPQQSLGLIAPTPHAPHASPGPASSAHDSHASQHQQHQPHDPYAQYGGLPPSAVLLHSATQPPPAASASAASSASSGSVHPLHAAAPSVQSQPRTLSQPATHIKPVAPKGFGDDD